MAQRPSLRPEQDKIYDLGSSGRRWGELFVGAINLNENLNTTSNILIQTGSDIINVGQKILELSSSLGTGNGTVKSINSIQPDENGDILLSLSQLSSSYTPTYYSSTNNELGLNKHLKGIDNKLNNIFYINNDSNIIGNNTFSGNNTFEQGKLTISGTIPSSLNDSSVVTSKWVSDKLGNLTGALTFKGEIGTNDNQLYSASLGDVYILKETGIIASQSVIKGNLIIFKSASIDTNTITSSSFNIVDNSPGIFIVNSRTGNNISLTTGDISEGESFLGTPSSLWFTNSRARSAISVTGSYINYDSGSGIISSSLTDSVIRSKLSVTGSGLSYDSGTGLITLGVASFSSSSIRDLFSSQGSYLSYDSGSGIISSSLTDSVIRSKLSVTGSGLSYDSATGIISASLSSGEIRNLLSVTGSYLSYDSESGVISSSLTNSIFRNNMSVTGSYLSYDSGSGIISSSLTNSIIKDVSAEIFSDINESGISFTYDSDSKKYSITTDYIVSINNISSNSNKNVMLYSDDINEGETKLYFTPERAISASVVNNVEGNETNKSPSVSSIKSYISSSITNSIISDSHIKNLISSSDSYISYNKDTGVISSSIYDNFLPRSLSGVASGLATLGADGKVPSAQLSPLAITDVDVVVDESAMLSISSPSTGDVAIITSNNKKYIFKDGSIAGYNGTGWLELTTSDNISIVNGQSGPSVTLTTQHISESNNLYYTDSRARSAVSVAGSYLNYDNNTGVISSSLTDSVILSKLSVTGSGLSYDSATGIISASLSTGEIRNLLSVTGSYISYDNSTGVISSSLNQSGIRSLLSSTGEFINYASGSGVISLSLSSGSIKDISKQLFDGSHTGISFLYDTNTKQITATVSAQGNVNTVNSIQADANKNITLLANNINSDNVPFNYLIATPDLDAHLTGIDNKLGQSVLTSNNNTFTGDNEFANLKITANKDIDASLANKVLLPAIIDNFDQVSNPFNAVNKNYLVNYTNNASGNYLKKSDNLSGLTDPAASRDNLGLGTAAILNEGISTGNVVKLTQTGLPAVSGSNLLSLPSISKLSDVTITTVSNDQILQWNGEKWVNVDVPSPRPSIIKVDLPYTELDTSVPPQSIEKPYPITLSAPEMEKTVLLNPSENYTECAIPDSNASTKGKKIHIKNIYSAAPYTVIIKNISNPIHQIDNQDFIQLSQRYTCVTLQSDGVGKWWII